MLEKIKVLLVIIQGLNDCTVLQQLSPDKVVAIRFILASSIYFDDMIDSIHSPEHVDHLIAGRIAYVKSQVFGNLAEDKSDENSSSINSTK